MSNLANTGAPVAACPFCGGAVDNQLVAYGGSCPHCFGEIPGEDAPTDPGEEKKKAQLRAEEKKVRRGWYIPVLVAMPIPVAVVGVALYLGLRPDPPKPVLNLDDAAFEFGDAGNFVAYVEPPAVEATTKPAAGTPKKGTKTASVPIVPTPSNLAAAEAPIGAELGTVAEAPQTTKTTRTAGAADAGADLTAPATASASKSPGGIADIGFEVRRRDQLGVTLTDDNAIVEMIVYVMRKEMPKLRSCYERRLKENDSLRGAWSLQFTVTQAGKAANINAVPQGMSDSELEQCLEAQIATWPFQPIKADQPVTKRVEFKPS